LHAAHGSKHRPDGMRQPEQGGTSQIWGVSNHLRDTKNLGWWRVYTNLSWSLKFKTAENVWDLLRFYTF
jgi:hypothetical protein